MSKNEMYCGIGHVPRGKIRGTPEHCVQTNQVRYYGLEKINKNLLAEAKGKTPNLIKEQLKLKKIEDDAKILVNEFKKLKIILESDKARPSEIKKAQKKLDALLIKRDKLSKRVKAQQKVVHAIEEEGRRLEKQAKKNSGSKTSKKASSKKTSSKKTSSKSNKSKRK